MIKLIIIASSLFLFSCGKNQNLAKKATSSASKVERPTVEETTESKETPQAKDPKENLFAKYEGASPTDLMLRETLDAEIDNVGMESVSIGTTYDIDIEEKANSCNLKIVASSKDAACDLLFYNDSCLKVLSEYVYYFACQGPNKPISEVLAEALDKTY